MTTPTDELIAFSDERAARLAGVSLEALRRWEVDGFVRPSVVRQISERNTVRLFGFLDLEALLVVSELQKRSISTLHIHALVSRLQREYERPLNELKWATEPGGTEVFFQRPDGTWEGSRRPRHIRFYQVLDLEEIRATIRSAARAQRTAEQRGSVVQRRKLMGRRPVFAGTRIPVDTVIEYLVEGVPDAEILEAFPRLTTDDLDAARELVAAS